MENNNSVCFVAEITEIKEIQGADNIELAIAGGWNCITPKGEYNQGARVIIATTDAVIPESIADSMGITSYLRKGNRVRTVKLRGVYSECLIIPTQYAKQQYLKVGDDKMEELNITKYEPPVKQIQLASGRKIKFRDNPNFPIYYKFPNLKNVQGMFNEGDEVQITRKIHGTNTRYGIVKKLKLSFLDRIKKFFRIADKWIDYEFIYGSHNVQKGSDSVGFYSTDVWLNIANELQIKEKLFKYINENHTPETLGSGIVLYGEIFGAGIQKNYDYGLDEIRFCGFDVVENDHYLDTFSTQLVINECLNLDHVKVLHVGKWSQEIQDKFTYKNYINKSKIPHEGIVIKCITGDRRKVAKVINPEYLIYGEKHEVGDSH
jgi:RNA ligase (TIGR02306 family)